MKLRRTNTWTAIKKKIRNLLLYIGIPVVVLFIIIFLFNNRTPQQATYKYSDIIDYFQTQQVTKYRLNLGTGEMAITLEDGKTIGYVLPSVDLFYMDVKEDIDQYNEDHPDNKMVQDIIRPVETSWVISLLPTLILFVGLIIFWVIMMRRLGSSMGGDKQMNFGKAKIKQMSDEKRKTTFADVAGADEEKEELREIVEFLKNPNKYNSELGARIPKGVLLVGPPGTGKTLLARAVAGEAGVPFFSISGSDFVEMFVGVGASRVRDLFDKAKKNHPCIIFIDEIDAVGRQRGAGLGGGHDEREQTLNQLLVEMDGFGANEGVIMIAATNRPDILDPALMRPGRFDRQVMVGYPDIKGREEILKVHAKGKPLAPDVDALHHCQVHRRLYRRRSGEPAQRGRPAGSPEEPSGHHHGGDRGGHHQGGGGHGEEEPCHERKGKEAYRVPRGWPCGCHLLLPDPGPCPPDLHYPPGYGRRLYHAACPRRTGPTRAGTRCGKSWWCCWAAVLPRLWCWMTSPPAPPTTSSGPPRSPVPW